jgi:hypothetical protein
MKRREAKFVHASPRLAPGQVEAAPHPYETVARPPVKGAHGKTAGAVTAIGGSQARKVTQPSKASPTKSR